MREPLISRRALHAAVLAFAHPITRKPLVFQVPPPAGMRDLIALLRAHQPVEAPNVAGTTIDLESML